MGNTKIPQYILIQEQNKWTIKSYAKINWILEILSLRNDQYHNISSVFDIIDLYDIINVELSDSSTWDVKISCNLRDLERRNIIYDLFDRLEIYNLGRKYKVKVELFKNIPLGGGLGGGSSNAASIIFLLYKLGIINLSLAFRICTTLGSDVLPIFLLYLYQNSYVFCFSKQDLCVPIQKNSDNSIQIILLIFPFGIETKKAYSEYDKIIIQRNFLIGHKTHRFLYFLKHKKLSDYFIELIHNDFEKVIYNLYPEISYTKDSLYSIFGKENLRVFLCGSGSTLAIIPKDQSIFHKLKTVIKDLNVFTSEVRVWL